MKEEIVIENGIELEKHIYYYQNGNIKEEYYFKEGKYHRENLPAFIQYYPNGNIQQECYHKEYELHRENGPAFIWYYENGNIKEEWYYINGIKITDDLQIMVMKGLSNA